MFKRGIREIKPNRHTARISPTYVISRKINTDGKNDRVDEIIRQTSYRLKLPHSKWPYEVLSYSCPSFIASRVMSKCDLSVCKGLCPSTDP